MMSAEFIIGAVKPELFPAGTLPEIAFLGRSNVGKSSLINCLVGKKGWREPAPLRVARRQSNFTG